MINCVEIAAPDKSSGRVVYQRMIVEYETASQAQKAIKYMNGGMYNYCVLSKCFNAVNYLQ